MHNPTCSDRSAFLRFLSTALWVVLAATAGCSSAPRTQEVARLPADQVGRPGLTAAEAQSLQSSVMALADSVIERDLGIDGISESVLYAAGVGRPPRGVAWAPLARGAAPKLRPNRRLLKT